MSVSGALIADLSVEACPLGQWEQERQYEGMRAADELFDREAIERRAWELIEQRDQVPAVEVRTQEREDNARTALMEAITASGHLSVVELHGTLEEINAQVLRRLLNGWDETLPKHERDRRFAEICNELVIQAVHGAIVEGVLPPDTEVLEQSDHPEALLGMALGYRDANRKGMDRSTGLRFRGNGQYTRVIEQVSRSNSHDGSTFSFLESCSIQPRYDVPADIAGLMPVIYTRRDYIDGVVDVIRSKDWHASRIAGQFVLYGDTGERSARHPEYSELRHESVRRERGISAYIGKLAAFEQQLDEMLAEGEISRADHVQMFQEEVIRILNAICTLDPGYAEDTFGRRSVVLFEQASLLTAQGRIEEAAALLEQNGHLKDAVTFCGMTISIEEAKKRGLKVNGFGELVEEGKEDWVWKQGVCQVKTCPSPKPTEVGPCSVCRRCQREFDAGRDPTKAENKVVSMVRKLGKIATKFGFSKSAKSRTAKLR